MKKVSSFKSFLAVILCLSTVHAAAFQTSAQTRRKASPKGSTHATNQPVSDKQSAQKCNGGWSGIITFTKTRNYAHDTGKVKSASFGTETQKKYSQDYKYAGRIVVDGSQNSNSVTTNSQVTLTDVRKTWSRLDQRDSCFYDGIDGQVPQWTEKNESDITNAFGEGSSQFWMNVNELRGTYSFSFRFPQANGTNDRSYDQTSGGWCNPESNKPQNSTKKYPEKVDGEGTEISDQKIDPARPDVLSGSKTWETGGTASTKTVYTVTWSFKRCPAPVEVTDIRFDEHQYPDYTAWKEIETARGTVDGNIVRIRATVTNFSGETKFPTIKFNETVENWVLPEGEKSIRLEPGESREVELKWDTAGYAWQGKGYDAESYRKIKVEADDDGRVSQLTKLIVVKPRPVILVHGLWSNAAAWNGYDKFFEEGHSASWKSFAVGADPSVAKMNTGETFGNTAQTNTIEQNARQLDKQIQHVHKTQNAWHVDLVAHSMGGLIARQYIADRMPLHPLSRRPFVTRLIMLGTPNAGSPCAKLMYAAFAASGNKIWALWELMPDSVEKFNDAYSNRRGVRFSALVGWRIPSTCQSPSRGDGVVTVGSARFKIMDWRYSNSLSHTDLTSRPDFGSFVFPRLSIGPRGNHDPEIETARSDWSNDETLADGGDTTAPRADRYGFNSMFRKASYKTENVRGSDEKSAMGDVEIEGMTLSKQVKLEANQTSVVEIPMTSGSRASVFFVASPNVSATLVDSAGNVVGKNTAGTPESKQMFRVISADKPVTNGTWKLTLENKEANGTNVLLAAFADPDPIAFSITSGKPSAAKQVALQAKLTNNNAPVTGAVVKAKIQSESGQIGEIVLLDDGAHGDGAAGDGVYGALTEKLADGDYLIEVRAETSGQIRHSAASFSIGNEAKNPPKPNVQRSKK